MEPPNPSIKGAVGLYVFAGFLAVAAILTREWELPQNRPDSTKAFHTGYRRIPFLVSILLLMLSFFAFGGNRFTAVNLTLWIAGLGFLLYSLWVPGEGEILVEASLPGDGKPVFTINVTAWTVLVILSLLVVTFYRFYRLNQVPGEMFSDHAEKLLDVGDILNGQYSVFFPRNTGREFVQMYLTAIIASLAQTGINLPEP